MTDAVQMRLDHTSDRKPPKESDSNETLYNCWFLLNSKKWRPADFQRKFVWNAQQITEWGLAIEDNNAIGVIVTYQLPHTDQTVYLLDGLQRLSATGEYIADPQRYGFPYVTEKAVEYAQAFKMPVQHRIFENHEVAWRSFVRLNRGTILTPYELYAGKILFTGPAGEVIIADVPHIVEKYEAPYITNPGNERGKTHSRKRDTYSLFLQYASGTKQLELWNVTGSNVSLTPKSRPVEVALAQHIIDSNWTGLSVKDVLADFERFIQEQIAEIATVFKEAGGEGYGINSTLMRWMLHVAIWRKNNGRPVVMYQDLIRAMLRFQLERHHKTVSKFDLPNTHPVQSVTLTMAGPEHLSAICQAFQSPLHSGVRRRQTPRPPGFHDSHIEPFAIYGNGETFAEPGPRNRARGARPVANPEDAAGLPPQE